MTKCSDVVTQLRNDLGLSVEECAAVARCRPETWDRLERGDIDVPVILSTLISKFAPKLSHPNSEPRSPQSRATLPETGEPRE